MPDAGVPLTSHLDSTVETFVARLPPEWHEPSALGLMRWQWAALPLLALAVWFLSRALVRLTTKLALSVARNKSGWQRAIQAQAGPLKLWWASWLTLLAVHLMQLPDALTAVADLTLRVGVGLSVFLGSLRALRDWTARFLESPASMQRPGSRALVSLLSGVGQFALVGIAVLMVLSALGYQVSSVLAGLGIGGIAVALGAQKTLENLFGALALAIDQPMYEGDYVQADGLAAGTVEKIGLRSTRIRTLDRTLLTIPNGKLADMRLENFTKRDRFRLFLPLTLAHNTTAAQLETVLAGFHEVLKTEETLWPLGTQIHLAGVQGRAPALEVQCWFGVTDMAEFRDIRQRVLLGFLRVIEKAGTSLAFPGQSVELLNKP